MSATVREKNKADDAHAEVAELRRQLALDAYDLLDSAPEQAYDDIVKLAVMLCQVPAAAIALVDHDRLWFKSRSGIAAAQIARAGSICEHAIHAPDRLLVVDDPARDGGCSDLRVGAHVPRFYAGMPLRSRGGHALGQVFVMDVVPRVLSPAQQEGLQVLARQTEHLFELRRYVGEQNRMLAERAAATQQLQASNEDLQRRHETLKHRAARDPLTGLLNRAALAQLREDPAAMARLDAAPYSLMLIDIDNFKQVNDRHGHLLGDRALRAVADAVSSSIREGDVAVRYGGEEILVVLPGTRIAGAAELAERVRKRVTQAALPFTLSVSIGLAGGEGGSEADGDRPEQVFERADQALYRAKTAGRNRVVADDTMRVGGAPASRL